MVYLVRLEYPRTLMESERQFSTERSCREYLYRLRWPDGFVCPRCQGSKAWPTSRQRLTCAGCGYEASLTAGTIFQHTRKPLVLWLRAVWWVTAQKNGASALGLQRVLGLGQYKTAWTWLHKLRRAMLRPGRDRLNGAVEVDEIYVGGKAERAKGRKLGTRQSLVMVAVERDGKRVPDASANSLEGFVQAAVQAGSTVRTDGWPSYSRLEALGYRHEVTVTAGNKDLLGTVFPAVHRVASLLKRWLMGTHHGAVSPHYLDYYLDEFTFRFNRRKSRSRGLLFRRLLEQAMQVDPIPKVAP